jgi:YggT family protein
MIALFETIYYALDIYKFILIASIIFSWLFAFNVINSGNQFVAMVGDFLQKITEPALGPIRRIMPNLGGIDLSPIVLFVIIFFIQRLIATTIIPALL